MVAFESARDVIILSVRPKSVAVVATRRQIEGKEGFGRDVGVAGSVACAGHLID